MTSQLLTFDVASWMGRHGISLPVDAYVELMTATIPTPPTPVAQQDKVTERVARLESLLNHAVTELSRAAFSEDFDGEDCANCIKMIEDEFSTVGKTTDWQTLSNLYDRLCAACGVSNEDEIDIMPIVEERLRASPAALPNKLLASIKKTIDHFIQMPCGTVWTEYHWRAALQLNKEFEELLTSTLPNKEMGPAAIQVYCERSRDGRVFANVCSNGKQLAHLKAGESWKSADVTVALNRKTVQELVAALVKLAEEYDPAPEGNLLTANEAIIDFLHGDEVTTLLATPVAQQPERKVEICRHGRNVWADDCGMCDAESVKKTEYPNLEALSQGCVSGRFSEWPQLRLEAKKALEELARNEERK